MPGVFVSYSHRDPEWHARVAVQLDGLRAWSDVQIHAGEDWNATIRAAMDASQVAVLLVSPGFLASR